MSHLPRDHGQEIAKSLSLSFSHKTYSDVANGIIGGDLERALWSWGAGTRTAVQQRARRVAGIRESGGDDGGGWGLCNQAVISSDRVSSRSWPVR